MIKNEEIKKIVILALISGFLKKNKPISLLIVARSGSGKTEVMKSVTSKRSAFLTDVNYSGFIELLKKDPKLTHILIPDFLKITMKKKSTSDNLISILNAFTEEGLEKIQGYFNEDFEGRVGGIIIATTSASYNQHKSEWCAIGFVSRMIICSYKYHKDTKELILDHIINEEEFKKPKKISATETFVKSCRAMNIQLKSLARNDFRKMKQFITLTKSNALYNKRKEVIQEDIDEIIRLSQYLNLDYNEL